MWLASLSALCVSGLSKPSSNLEPHAQTERTPVAGGFGEKIGLLTALSLLTALNLLLEGGLKERGLLLPQPEGRLTPLMIDGTSRNVIFRKGKLRYIKAMFESAKSQGVQLLA